MQRVLLLSGFIFLFSCNEATPQNPGNTVQIENGLKEKVNVPYSLSKDLMDKIDPQQIENLGRSASSLAETDCKFPKSYIPLGITFSLAADTLNAEVLFSSSKDSPNDVPDSKLVTTRFIKTGEQWKTIPKADANQRGS